MPAHRSRMAFEPIPPDLDINAVVASTPNFQFGMRITCDTIDQLPLEHFEKLVLYQVVLSGRPLIIEGFQKYLDKNLFSERWLRETHSSKTEVVRDITKKKNTTFSMGHYLQSLPLLARRMTTNDYARKDRQRLYMKDIDCPQEWHDFLKNIIPPSLFYLNEAPKNFQGPASGMTTPSDFPRTADRTLIAPAGDLMSSLPANQRAENLMCYIGHEGTYTPAHQEMCASLGHNLMVEASHEGQEHGQQTASGSSIWLMTDNKDRHVVAEYWMSVLGHDIDIEDFFAPLHAWQIAPFTTWVVEQKPGDLILVPPLAAHQVWNRGTRTMKVAWNRTTVDTLELALREALPHARMVCRDEQYKNKAIVYFTLERYSKLLQGVKKMDHPVVEEMWKDFGRLFTMYKDILLSESFSKKSPEKSVEYHEYQSNVTCSFCRCNIFNRFLTCNGCADSKHFEEELGPYDVCMDCYAMGRSCGCVSKLQWVEQFPIKQLTDRYDSWRRLIVTAAEGKKDIKEMKEIKQNFPTLVVARGQAGKRSIAEICQEQLARRPWNDPQNPTAAIKPPRRLPRKGTNGDGDGNDDGESDDDDGDDDKPRKKRKIRHSVTKNPDGMHRCHVCLHLELDWKLATCSNCDQHYCYGSLYRAFEIRPNEAMEKHHWLCPKCRKVCSCGACQRDPNNKPYAPNFTVLGHDTSTVADPRSIEALVDFRKSNLWWLKKFGGDDVHERIAKRQKEADEAELARHNKLEAEGFKFETSPFDQPGHENGYDALGLPVDPSLIDGTFLTVT
ncbi:unnamed protein product [Penicillium olsonii]|uniref:JmjC domain-containing protein n=1 Tax=Penicillium olsonii TaxID=99116 RepID=A0A9W4HKH1_PENOL|nr:unnamed protein product [Penicillium olsonii]CAG8044484.1 unnamed protein product [Penicillium olsonii]